MGGCVFIWVNMGTSMNTINKPLGAINAGNCLTSWAIMSVSEIILLHGMTVNLTSLGFDYGAGMAQSV